MKLGMIGFGRMGANMTRRLIDDGHECVVYDLQAAAVKELEHDGATGARSLDDLVAELEPPRVVWIMVPAAFTAQTVFDLAERLEPGDIVVDGGNSYYKDDIERAAALAAGDIHLVDVGTSGGVWGRERGHCLMIGGAADAVAQLQPVFASLSPGLQAASRTEAASGRRQRRSRAISTAGPAAQGTS